MARHPPARQASPATTRMRIASAAEATFQGSRSDEKTHQSSHPDTSNEIEIQTD